MQNSALACRSQLCAVTKPLELNELNYETIDNQAICFEVRNNALVCRSQLGVFTK